MQKFFWRILGDAVSCICTASFFPLFFCLLLFLWGLHKISLLRYAHCSYLHFTICASHRKSPPLSLSMPIFQLRRMGRQKSTEEGRKGCKLLYRPCISARHRGYYKTVLCDKTSPWTRSCPPVPCAKQYVLTAPNRVVLSSEHLHFAEPTSPRLPEILT